MPKRLIPKTQEEWLWIYRSVVLIAMTWALVSGVALIVGFWLFDQTTQQDIRRNEELIIALCRQNNTLRVDLQLALLDQGIPFHELRQLNPVLCTPRGIERGS